MKHDAVYRRLADVVAAKAGNNKIIKGTQSDRPGSDLVQGFSASGPDVWVTAADYTRPGVVLSAVGARCGKTFLAEGAWTAIANTHVLLPSPAVDHRWLWYLTNDELFWVRGGSAQPFVKVKDTLQKEVEIPPLPEQHRIVAILDESFESIATAKANAEKNLQNAHELFENYHQSVFSRGGEGWVDYRLGDIASFRNGINYTKQSKGRSVPIIGVKNFQNHLWAPLDDLDSVTLDGELSQSRDVRRTLIDGGNGANIRSLNQGTLSSVVIPLPPIEIQQRLINEIEAMHSKTAYLADIASRKLTALDELKKSLLNQAFTGQL